MTFAEECAARIEARDRAIEELTVAILIYEQEPDKDGLVALLKQITELLK